MNNLGLNIPKAKGKEKDMVCKILIVSYRSIEF